MDADLKARELAEMLLKHPDKNVYLFDDAASTKESTETKSVTGINWGVNSDWVIIR